jgi:hypothetical protein
MKQENPSNREPSAAPAKKPYQKPAFRMEKVFEVTALSCGKLSGTGPNCLHNRKVS